MTLPDLRAWVLAHEAKSVEETAAALARLLAEERKDERADCVEVVLLIKGLMRPDARVTQREKEFVGKVLALLDAVAEAIEHHGKVS